MVVVGQHAFVLSDTGRTAEVSAYTPDYNAMQVRIVDAGCWMLDAAIQYDYPRTGKVFTSW